MTQVNKYMKVVSPCGKMTAEQTIDGDTATVIITGARTGNEIYDRFNIQARKPLSYGELAKALSEYIRAYN